MSQHVIDYYQDGFTAIPFCKNCSAEGDALHEECKPIVYIDKRIVWQDMTMAEFEEKYQKAIDQSKAKR